MPDTHSKTKWKKRRKKNSKEDVEDYCEYAIYDVIVRTWAKRYRQFYWLEKWKLECCTIDNSFGFEEEAGK